jgi:predicted dehydrogenase
LPVGRHGRNRLAADFVAAVRRGEAVREVGAPLATFADGLRSQEAIAAAERAHGERRWVSVPEQ